MNYSHLKIIILVISLSLSQLVQAEEPTLFGKYEGIIWSNYEVPGNTEFYLTSDQKIEATYIFKNTDSDDSKGLLNECSLDVLILRCIWNDEYGMGDFVVEFTANFSSFSGKWFDEKALQERNISDVNGYLWNGEKKNS